VEALELYVEQRAAVLRVTSMRNQAALLDLLMNTHPDEISEVMDTWSQMKLDATNDQSTESIEL